MSTHGIFWIIKSITTWTSALPTVLLVIRNNMNEIILENPGGFRVTMGEALSGGVSSPRNAVILKMFNLLDIGDRTGSGIPKIFKSWKDEGLDEPWYTELFAPDRSILTLPLSL